MDPIAGVDFIQGECTEQNLFDDLLLLVGNRPVDLVISDMAPNLTGSKAVDQPAMIYLAELAIDLTVQVLKPEGIFISKVFQGEGFDQFVRHVRKLFNSVSMKKTKASRAKSREVYLIAKGLKSNWEDETLNDLAKNLVVWLVLAAILLSVFNRFTPQAEEQELGYSL